MSKILQSKNQNLRIDDNSFVPGLDRANDMGLMLLLKFTVSQLYQNLGQHLNSLQCSSEKCVIICSLNRNYSS